MLHHKDWLTYSDVTDRPDELCYNFSMVSMVVPPLGNSGHVVFLVSIDLPSNSKVDALFHCIAYDYVHTDWDGLRDHLRDVPCEHEKK